MFSPKKAPRDLNVSMGFSLIELLLVIALIGLVAAFLIPSIGNILASRRLTSATADFTSQLALARQSAVSAHAPVEMHIYQITDNEGAANFTAFRLFKLANTNSTNITAEPFTSVTRLPTGMAVVAQNDYSTLVTAQTNAPIAEAVPGEPGLVPYRALCFLPNGQVELSMSNNLPWTVTLAAKQFATAGTPANFSTLVVSPLTGKILVYRP